MNRPVEHAVRTDQSFALIIGIGNYQDGRIPKLNYTHSDAKAFYDLLVDPQRAGFPKDNVRMLLDEQATRSRILKAVNNWLCNSATPDSLVVIFFACHGAPEQDKTDWDGKRQAYYFLPWDADCEDLAGSSLSQQDFFGMTRKVQARRLVTFLDACHSSGVAMPGARDIVVGRAPSFKELVEGEGRVVIAAAKPEQCSWEDEKFKHGIFTYHLLEALRGKADTNGDGYVSIQEVAAYLSREVPATVKRLGKQSQDPTMICESLTHDIILTVDAARVKKRAQELSEAEQELLERKQAGRLRLVELRKGNELSAKEFTEAMLINEKVAEELTPTETLLKEYVDLLVSNKISAQLYLKTRERIHSDTRHIRRDDPEPPKLQPVYCIHCGGRNAADNVFCFQCGKKLR